MTRFDKLKIALFGFQLVVTLIAVGSYLQRLLQPIQVQVTCPVPPPSCCCDDSDDGGVDGDTDAFAHD